MIDCLMSTSATASTHRRLGPVHTAQHRAPIYSAERALRCVPRLWTEKRMINDSGVRRCTTVYDGVRRCTTVYDVYGGCTIEESVVARARATTTTAIILSQRRYKTDAKFCDDL